MVGDTVNPYKLRESVYMTAGIKRLLIRSDTSEEVRNALKRFENRDYGEFSEKPDQRDISEFGSYKTSFGAVWIINYKLFQDRDFITVLLPCEFDN